MGIDSFIMGKINIASFSKVLIICASVIEIILYSSSEIFTSLSVTIRISTSESNVSSFLA